MKRFLSVLVFAQCVALATSQLPDLSSLAGLAGGAAGAGGLGSLLGGGGAGALGALAGGLGGGAGGAGAAGGKGGAAAGKSGAASGGESGAAGGAAGGASGGAGGGAGGAAGAAGGLGGGLGGLLGAGGLGGLAGLGGLGGGASGSAVLALVPESIKAKIPAATRAAIEKLKASDLDALKPIAIEQVLLKKYKNINELLNAVKTKAPAVYKLIESGLKDGGGLLKQLKAEVGPEAWPIVENTYKNAKGVAKKAAQDWLKMSPAVKAQQKAKFPMLYMLLDDPLFQSFFNLLANDGKKITKAA
ncbi:hypothetical protein AAVH_19615 [Aphelenchoides avenae]|nr:hypothetical protein AAVH_19615 [Aphelenchus avenae]